MWGEQNPQLPVSDVAGFTAALVSAQRVEQRIYPEVGHVIPLEIPARSARDAHSFLSGD